MPTIIIIISMNRNWFFYCIFDVCLYNASFNTMRKPIMNGICINIYFVDFKEIATWTQTKRRNINAFGQLCRSHLWARMQIFDFLMPVVSKKKKNIFNGFFFGNIHKHKGRIQNQSSTYIHRRILSECHTEVYHLMCLLFATEVVEMFCFKYKSTSFMEFSLILLISCSFFLFR